MHGMIRMLLHPLFSLFFTCWSVCSLYVTLALPYVSLYMQKKSEGALSSNLLTPSIYYTSQSLARSLFAITLFPILNQPDNTHSTPPPHGAVLCLRHAHAHAPDHACCLFSSPLITPHRRPTLAPTGGNAQGAAAGA
jgi:hypothetical protein